MRLSIKSKLIILIFLTTASVLLVGFAIDLRHEYAYSKKLVLEKYKLVDRLLGESLIKPVVAKDTEEIGKILLLLNGIKELNLAVVYGLDGEILGSFQNPRVRKYELPSISEVRDEVSDAVIRQTYRIQTEKALYGTLYIEISALSFREVSSMQLQSGIVTLSIFLVLALGLALVMQGLIAKPISNLVNVLRSVTNKDDYSIRVDYSSSDEIGELYSVFNNMLERLEQREKARRDAEIALERYRGHLEELVLERTEELNQAHRELIKSERLATIGQLIATVSHELRNPLGTIVSSVYTLSQRARDSNLGLEIVIQRIEKNVQRCVNIIEELLDYTRNKESRFEQVKVDEWLKLVVDEMSCPQGVTLSWNLEANTAIGFQVENMRRAVLNVVQNAYQAMENNEVENRKSELCIRSRLEGQRCRIEFVDSGQGISEEKLDKIYEPLYSTKSYGVGLGLPIVKQIVEQHQGEICVSSSFGTGTTVTFLLPLKREFPAATEPIYRG